MRLNCAYVVPQCSSDLLIKLLCTAAVCREEIDSSCALLDDSQTRIFTCRHPSLEVHRDWTDLFCRSWELALAVAAAAGGGASEAAGEGVGGLTGGTPAARTHAPPAD
jgi:hypothetical protein